MRGYAKRSPLSSISGASSFVSRPAARDNGRVIEDPHFSLDLDEAWRRLPEDAGEQYDFRDDSRDIVITLSAVGIAIETGCVDQFAQMLVDMRMQAEHDAALAFGHSIILYEAIVMPFPWGRAVVYYGHDDMGRQFSYSGIVTRASLINFYMSTSRLSQQQLLEAMDEIGSRIVFDRTPLDAIPGIG
jgi:hypothetical protein